MNISNISIFLALPINDSTSKQSTKLWGDRKWQFLSIYECMLMAHHERNCLRVNAWPQKFMSVFVWNGISWESSEISGNDVNKDSLLAKLTMSHSPIALLRLLLLLPYRSVRLTNSLRESNRIVAKSNSMQYKISEIPDDAQTAIVIIIMHTIIPL